MHIKFDEHLGILSFILKCGNYAVQNCTWNICNRKRGCVIEKWMYI